jgi:hypothetical protein
VSEESDDMRQEPTGFPVNMFGESRAEYCERRMNERGAEIERMLEVMRTALVCLEQGDDPVLAQRYLRACLRKFGR